MNKISKILIIVGILLILYSIFNFGYYKFLDLTAGISSNKVLNIIEETKIEDEKEILSIGNYDYIGFIEIPSINLKLPVIDKFDYKRLKKAPCLYYGSITSNNMVICGHSYKTHFRYLSKLQKNDLIIFNDLNGKKRIYKVEEIEVVSPISISKVIENGYNLTLFTCTLDGLNRVVVKSNEVYENTYF